MRGSIARFWVVASGGVLYLTLASAQSGPSVPRHAESIESHDARGHMMQHREVPDDPPMQRRAQPPPGVVARSDPVIRGQYSSIQVNLDAVGRDIRGDAANEPSIAVDPTDPDRIVIGWRQFDTIESNFRQAGWAYSHNGGRIWTCPGVVAPGVFGSDPVLSVDVEGNFYYYSLQPERGLWACYLYKSSDGGVSWPQEIYGYGGDKAWFEIDRTHGVGQGNIYISWDYAGCCDPYSFTRSIDGGHTFMYPIAIPDFPYWGTIAVGPDGAVYVAGIKQRPAFIVAKSTNAENPNVTPTFDFVSEVNLAGRLLYMDPGPNPGGLLGQVWIAADHSHRSTRGNLYVLCSVEPNAGGDPLDVMFARSTDGGVTWSDPVRVNDDPVGNDAWQWFGTLSVAPNGRIDVIWNDTRNTGQENWSELYYAYSEDAGLTWSENEPVSPAFDSHIGWPNQNKLGDYYHAISDDRGVNVAYAATFKGGQDVYFLRIPFDCNHNGVPDLDDIVGDTSQDCNENEVPDECEPDEDCNDNGVQDICDISGGTSFDCNDNDNPDECMENEEDCNGNGAPDACDIAEGTSADCNFNDNPDECTENEADCNDDGSPDSCEIAEGTSLDCDANGLPDECHLDGRCEVDKLTSDAGDANHEFGNSVSTRGEVVLVGAHLDDGGGVDAGAAYVFRRRGALWNDRHRLAPTDIAEGDEFGRSVAIDGNVLIVGAPYDDHGGSSDAGSAYVFRWNGSGWREEQKLIASDAAEGDLFGMSVAINGNLAVIGAIADDDVVSGSGSAYIFRWDGDVWVEQQKLTAFDPGAYDNFGYTVSVSGDVVVVAAPNDDDDGSGSGSAYAYRWNGSTWSLHQKLTASDAAVGDRFGRSVSVDGDDLVIGAYRDDDAGFDAGSAYYFQWKGVSWREQQKLFAFDAAANDGFGQSASISGDSIVVGAYLHDDSANDAGAIYVFVRSGDGWVEEAEFTASDAGAGDRFGWSVALEGGLVVAGAPFAQVAGTPSGAAYVFALDGSPDCNGNCMPDVCDISSDPSLDCDEDGVVDICAIATGSVEDCNNDGVPDSCEVPPLLCHIVDPPQPGSDEVAKMRYLSLQADDIPCRTALRVTLSDLPVAFEALEGKTLWVGEPVEFCENSGQATPPPDGCEVAPGLASRTFSAALLQCSPHYTYWGSLGTIHLYHEVIVPGATYDVQAIDEGCDETDEDNYSSPLTIHTSRWGDVVTDCTECPCLPPDGTVSVITDVVSILNKFSNLDCAPTKARTDIQPSVVDFRIDITDVVQCLGAFTGTDYPFTPQDPCP